MSYTETSSSTSVTPATVKHWKWRIIVDQSIIWINTDGIYRRFELSQMIQEYWKDIVRVMERYLIMLKLFCSFPNPLTLI